jgi:molybdopterin-guanine dinucleotide biosynthesis protein A
VTQPSQARVSGIILAGGQSRRLGRDKAVEPVGGQPLIRRVIERVSPVSSEIVVVVADRARGEALPLAEGHRVALDIYPGKGSLGGIFSGLTAVREEWGLVVACDMPFLNLELLRYMMSLREGVDAVVPVLEGRTEPTHALYSRSCLPYIEERLKADDLKIARFFDEVRVRYVPEEDISRFDPDHLSFFNINSQPDLDQALALAAQGR